MYVEIEQKQRDIYTKAQTHIYFLFYPVEGWRISLWPFSVYEGAVGVAMVTKP
jgi:hypothetical protein